MKHDHDLPEGFACALLFVAATVAIIGGAILAAVL